MASRPHGTGTHCILIANPSADVYGSDLQMLESISAMVERGWRVVVAIPAGGELVEKLESRGAEVRVFPFPVLRRANASTGGIASLAASAFASLATIRAEINEIGPAIVYVNTVTLPWWILAARLARRKVIVHVHEAETEDKRIVRLALNAPLLLAHRLILISRSTRDATNEAVPGLRSRGRLVFNGVERGPVPLSRALIDPSGTIRVAMVCRLSPRKAPDVALEAMALLRGWGLDVRLEICGTPFGGYEWFEDQLRMRASQPDLSGSVTFSGYVSPIWSAIDRADIVVAPSLREPFGNAVVEAQLSLRPVVASQALGHTESIVHGVSGLLVEPGSAEALARAVKDLIDYPALAEQIASGGRASALANFSKERYADDIASVLVELSDAPQPVTSRKTTP